MRFTKLWNGVFDWSGYRGLLATDKLEFIGPISPQICRKDNRYPLNWLRYKIIVIG